jgi:signal transduction histidine kinase
LDKTDNADHSEIDFMSALSHELSTPLGSVRWNAELLKMGKMTKPLDAEQAQIMDEIIAGVKRMSAFVTDIHEASWLERDKFGDDPAPTSLAELVSRVQGEQQADITAKKLTFTVETEPELPAVKAHPSTLLLIVQNLISNAIKYTAAEGTVKISLRTATDDESARIAHNDQQCIFLSVADTGFGIPAAQHDQVFQKLFRADNVRAMEIDGTGLGLYIVSLAVAKLGGAIWFESAEQQGTTFFVVLPQDAGQAAK